MIRRAISLAVIIWALSFAWFALFLPQPAGPEKTDGIIVFTGTSERILRGLDLLKAGQAPLLLVSGVDREVKPREFAAHFSIDPQLMRCCITLGFDARDTRSNAKESGAWIAAHHLHSVRLVTNDWHMRRAAAELDRAVGDKVRVVRDGVPSHPSLGTLVLEYHKWVAQGLGHLIGL